MNKSNHIQSSEAAHPHASGKLTAAVAVQTKWFVPKYGQPYQFSYENSYKHTYLKVFTLEYLVKTFSTALVCPSSPTVVVFSGYSVYMELITTEVQNFNVYS